MKGLSSEVSCVANGSRFVYKTGVKQSVSKLPSLETVRTVVRAVCEKQPVARVQAFGSLVNGVPNAASDVDLLVEFLTDVHVGLLEMGALKEDLEERLGCPVDLVSRAAVEKSRNPYRRRSILAAPVTVYAANDYDETPFEGGRLVSCSREPARGLGMRWHSEMPRAGSRLQ